MPIPTLDSPVQFSDALPDAVDFVIIGAGIAGLCTAWHLLSENKSVLICDKGRVACEQSSRNWGWVRQQGRDAAELPIMIDAMHVWDEIAKKVGGDVGFRRQGTLYLASNDREMSEYAAWLKVAERYQLDTRLVDNREISELVSGNTGGWTGGIYTASDGRAEPYTAAPAIAGYLHQHGVLIRENCAVRCLDIDAGRVRGVVTESGNVRAGKVLLAGGAWSSRFLGNHDISLPQLLVRATVARTDIAEDFYKGNAADHSFAFRRREDGGYSIASGGAIDHFVGNDSFRYLWPFRALLRQSFSTISLKFGGNLLERIFAPQHWRPDEVSPFEETRILNPAPSAAVLKKLRRDMQQKIPALAEVPLAQIWAGMIDVMPDVVPVMDNVPGLPGLVVGTGFSGHGFGFGPGSGRVLSDLLLENDSPYDLSRFRFSRFSDGSSMVPGPGI